MSHPDGMLALLGGHSPITAHFTSVPFMYQEVEHGRVHTILNSYDVLGEPHTFNAMWTTHRYHDANPQVVAAFLAALERAMVLIRDKPGEATAIWLKAEPSGMDAAQAVELITRPENEWTTAPRRVMAIARFMYETGGYRSCSAWAIGGCWKAGISTKQTNGTLSNRARSAHSSEIRLPRIGCQA
jgi:NitT/TauT family transport system substrate-binding protein